MSHRPLLSTLLLLVLPAGCADADIDAGPGAAVEVRDSAGISVVENGASGGAPLLTLSPQPTFDVGSLAAGGPEQLHRVAAATSLADGSVAVLDGGSAEVRVFAPDGAFMRALGGEGEGPGEFSSAAGLWSVQGDSLLVWDRRLRRVTVFGPDGDLGRMTSLEGGLVNADVRAVFEDGSLLVSQLVLSVPESGYVPVPIVLTRHDADGALADSLGQMVFAEMGPWDLGGGAMRVTARLFAPRASVAGDAGGYWVGTGRAHELRRHAPDGRIVVLARWQGADRRVTDADARADLEAALARTPEERHESTRRAWDNREVAERFPAHGAVLPTGDGGALVSPFERPRDAAPRPWLLFDAEGRLTARVTIPGSFRPTEVGDDWMLGVETDELDVEYVRRYDLVEGGES